MRLKKVGEWIQYTGAMGRTFYFNEKTFEFQWERPEVLGEEEPSKAGSNGGGSGGVGKGGGRDKVEKGKMTAEDSARAEKQRELKKAQMEKMKILHEWTTYRDPNTGLAFWHNKVTEESLWEPPPGLAALEKKMQKMASELEEDEEDAEAVVIGGLDDLGI